MIQLKNSNLILKPIESEDYKRLKLKKGSNIYYFLHDQFGTKLNDTPLRKGGIGGQFKDGYCMLIKFMADKEKGYDPSRFCMIDVNGEIVYEKKKEFGSLYHFGGVLVSDEDEVYNISTGEKVLPRINKYIQSRDYLFAYVVSFDVNFKSGVYMVEKETGEYQHFES